MVDLANFTVEELQAPLQSRQGTVKFHELNPEARFEGAIDRFSDQTKAEINEAKSIFTIPHATKTILLNCSASFIIELTKYISSFL